ncbi:cell division protein FtsL [Latilactobacillus sakei]|uniref:cell division protein FtsL n=1 Tax=Latilactobacillus sakei TaxID=1599 RepID=UPI003F53B802
MMATNAARQLTTPESIPSQVQEPTRQSAQQTTQKVAYSTLEKLAVTVIGIAFFVMLVSLLSTKIAVVNAQRTLENTTQDMSQTRAKNNDLKQEIGELTSSDRLDAFAKKNNLKLNENNIRNVAK